MFREQNCCLFLLEQNLWSKLERLTSLKRGWVWYPALYKWGGLTRKLLSLFGLSSMEHSGSFYSFCVKGLGHKRFLNFSLMSEKSKSSKSRTVESLKPFKKLGSKEKSDLEPGLIRHYHKLQG